MRTILSILLLALCGECAATKQASWYTNEQKQWGIAISTILSKRNNEDVFALAGDISTPDVVADQKASLERWWGIDSRELLIEMMVWARDEGHRAVYEKMRREQRMIPKGLLQWRDRLFRNHQSLNYKSRQAFVDKYGDVLGEKSLVVWDIARLVSLARWGVQCGYLTEHEAFEWIMPAAQQVQATYDSWEDMAENYLLGRQFWSVYHTRDSEYKYRAAAYWALHNASSPWIRMDWDLDLTGAAKPLLEEDPLPEVSDYFRAQHQDWAGRSLEAREVLLKVKDEGDVLYRGRALSRLGNMYEHGRKGIEKDWKQALGYYEQGAELGNEECLFEIGYAYYAGKGRPRDYAKAMDYWQRAANAGSLFGKTNIGLIYEEGKGVNQDFEKAAEIYREAAHWGSKSAENNLAWMMYKNKIPWDADEAVRMAYSGVHRWECLWHYDTLVKVLIRAERWPEALQQLNNWERMNMRDRNNYDPLQVPEKFKRLRKTIKDGLNAGI